MSVIVERPYKFVPPHRGNLWPSFIQAFRLVDFYLKRKEGVFSYECRHKERLIESYQADYGVLLAPNHCRYADPLVMGWLSRETDRHVFAMASWHLFNKGAFDRFAIPKMGGFSIFREGADRQSLETAIDAMVEAKRPLIVFPEGTTNRTNDHLQPLLDGVLFMARTAAKRRAKDGKGKVVIHPVGIKYLLRDEIGPWARESLAELETELSWHVRDDLPILSRIGRVAEGLLALKEVQYLGRAQAGNLVQRRDALIEALLENVESEFIGAVGTGHPLNRVRACRAKMLPILLESLEQPKLRARLRRKIIQVDLAQQLVSYPADYLREDQVTDTRILETLQRMQEDFFGRAKISPPLHVIIEVDHAIEVPDDRPARGQIDPVQQQMESQLLAMLARLSAEARPYGEPKSPADDGSSSAASRNLASTAAATVSAITESRMSL